MRLLSVLTLLALLLIACAPAATPTLVPATVQPAAPTPLPPTATAVAPAATAVPQSTAAPVRTLYPAPKIPIVATLVATEVSPLGYVHEYYVDAWWEDPNPPMGSNATLSASLLHNGLWSGGWVTFHWVQNGELQSFREIVIYQRGILTIPVTGFEPGVYVPVTYTFELDGKFYTGYAGFTPK
jgi:hypothetical protein